MEPTEFGKYLKSLRESAGLTIRELDKRSGVSHSYISKMESGAKGIPSPDILRKLAGPIGMTHTELMVLAGHIPESHASATPTPSSAFDKYIRSYVHMLIGDREHDFLGDIEEALSERMGELAVKHNVETAKKITIMDKDGLRDDIPEQYADMIIDVDNVQFKFDVLQELQDILHEFHIRPNPAYEVGARQPRPKELENIIEHENITYNDKLLEESDRQSILEMLKLLFRDRQ